MIEKMVKPVIFISRFSEFGFVIQENQMTSGKWLSENAPCQFYTNPEY